MQNRTKLKEICLSAVFAVVIAACAQISFPFFGAVLMTAQTLAVALCGYFLGLRAGSMALGVYLILGAIGVPVFSGFSSGFGVILGVSGGFLYGFWALMIPCALCRNRKIIFAVCMGILGLLICHTFGILHYSLISKVGLKAAFFAVSLPFLAKDAVCVPLAYLISKLIKRKSEKFNL